MDTELSTYDGPTVKELKLTLCKIMTFGASWAGCCKTTTCQGRSVSRDLGVTNIGRTWHIYLQVADRNTNFLIKYKKIASRIFRFRSRYYLALTSTPRTPSTKAHSGNPQMAFRNHQLIQYNNKVCQRRNTIKLGN